MKFSPQTDEILTLPASNTLVPNRNPDDALLKRLNALTLNTLFAPYKVVSRNDAECVRSGLYLWHDFLDESHAISQEIETQNGSYWHGILHRREPDYSNAKYWYRKVGQHAIFPKLATAASLKGEWDAFAFIDQCEQAVTTKGAKLEDYCRNVQKAEFYLLLEHCWIAAVGKL